MLVRQNQTNTYGNNFFVELWRNKHSNDRTWKETVKTSIDRLKYLPRLIYYWWRRRRYLVRGHEIAPLTLLPWSLPKGPGKLRVGNETSIHKVYMILHEDITIGSRVCINHHVSLMTGSHDTLDPYWRTFEKPIVIKDYAWIAEHAIILPGVTIGRGAIVGAGAVVRFDVPDYAVVSGNPGRAYPPGRTKELDYSPIRYIPAFRAWLGPDLIPEAEPVNRTAAPSSINEKTKSD